MEQNIQVLDEKDHVIYIDNWKESYSEINMLPTYTISEILYKLHEWICPTIDGKQFSGELKFIKDAPFYIFYYDLKTKDYDPFKFCIDQLEEWSEDFVTEFETPIESLAALLIQCHQKDIG